MIERGKGAVIWVSSVSALQPMPGHALYAATKAYISTLALGLCFEWRKLGIDTVVCEPGASRGTQSI